MDIESALRGVDLFSRMNPRQIGRLAKLATRREFPVNTRILRRGDTGVALYLILSGRVQVSVQPEDSDTETVLGEIGPGGVFGEMALIDEGPRSANVTTLEPTACALLTRWDFMEAVGHDADLARALLPVLCARIRNLQERLIQYEPRVTTD